MRTNHVKQKLQAGEPSLGSWLGLASPTAARFMAQSGFDWLTVDTEHMPIDLESAAAMFGVIAAAGVAPLVRVPWNNGQNIKRVLDCGAWGIVVPMVCSRQEADDAVGWAKHPPTGVRSIGGSLHALNFATDPATYYARANDEILVVLQIEHIAGVERANEILSVPGVDACFIGPNDLMASMNMTPKMDSPEPAFVQALAHVRDTCQQYGVAPGIHTADASAASARLADGWQFLAIASELRMMVAGAQAEINAVKGWQPRAAGEVMRY